MTIILNQLDLATSSANEKPEDLTWSSFPRLPMIVVNQACYVLYRLNDNSGYMWMKSRSGHELGTTVPNELFKTLCI